MTPAWKHAKCSAKVRYATARAARIDRDKLQKEHLKAYRVYRCGCCKGYHLTTNHVGTLFVLFDQIAQQRKAA